MLGSTKHEPVIINSDEGNYVIIGSVDHGMELPPTAVPKLVSALEGVEALIIEYPKNPLSQMHPMSTELLTRACVDPDSITLLSGNDVYEDIGDRVLKYAPRDLAEVYVPCLHVRISCHLGQDFGFDEVLQFTAAYKQRFGFLDVERTIDNYMKILQYWKEHDLDSKDLDHFSYDFEKFVGDIREFELWVPELRLFRKLWSGKRIAACAGDYHTPFIQTVFDGGEVQPPNWEIHIDTKRPDKITPQDPEFLKRVYLDIRKALSE